jgi:hypothetical protein
MNIFSVFVLILKRTTSLYTFTSKSPLFPEEFVPFKPFSSCTLQGLEVEFLNQLYFKIPNSIAQIIGGFTGGQGTHPTPFSLKIYHLMLVKLKI